MNTNFQIKHNLLRIQLMIGLILVAILPVSPSVSAQSMLAQFTEVRSISTTEFGVDHPKGFTFSPQANAFLLLGEGNTATALSLSKDSGTTVTILETIEDPLNVAVDAQSHGLYMLNLGKNDLPKVALEQNGLPSVSNHAITHFNVKQFGLQDPGGIAFDPNTGRLFILDSGSSQVVIVSPHPTQGFDGNEAMKGGKIFHSKLAAFTHGELQGIAYNPDNGHFYIGDPTKEKIYEFTEEGQEVSTFDLTALNFENFTTLLFAPSGDPTDDPNTLNLFVLDSGQSVDQTATKKSGQIVELSLQAPTGLPAGTTLLPAALVHIIDTSKAAWNPSSPDPSGVDYWPLTGRLLIDDSEVDEMPIYFTGKNVYDSTTSGTLVSTCSTTSFSNEPTGVGINPNNNHVFISTDSNGRVFEVGLGADGVYCTGDDTVTSTDVSGSYGITDAEDVAYGNNTVFVAGGTSAEVYRIPLGVNGVLGGGDDGPMTHFDTASLGFHDLEGIGYNADNGTLFIVSTQGSENYLGETSTTGTLLRAYDLSFMGTQGNIRSDVTYAPSSQNPAVKNIYIASRGIDNDSNPKENDGKVWEISLAMAAQVQVYIGGALRGGYTVPVQSSLRQSYPGVNGGPVEISSTNGVPIIGSERVIYNVGGVSRSFSEMMGLPNGQVNTTYWFPWSNNVDLDTQLRFANLSGSTASVNVYIAGLLMSGSPFTLGSGQSTRVSFAGVNNGPVKVMSNVPIVAAERIIYTVGGVPTSFSEMMGLPNNQLDTTYWFPWYNNVDLDTQLRFGNVGGSTASVNIYIHGALMTGSPFMLAPGQSARVSFAGINNGPVQIVSNVNIVAAERVIYKVGGTPTSFSEMMGLPNGQLATSYSLPWYNNVGLDTQLRFGNVSGSTASVNIYIHGALMSGTPFSLGSGQSKRISFVGVDNGPVKVVSNVPIVVAERVIYSPYGTPTSFSEVMGLPNRQLNPIYWLPWYNNIELDTQLRFGVP